jgi:hypothetical protein
LGGGGGDGGGDVQVTNNANKDVKVNNDVNNSGSDSDSGLYCMYFLACIFQVCMKEERELETQGNKAVRVYKE